VFLMDDRYHKYVRTRHHPTVPESECVIWGDEQLRWLCAGLARSRAPVKLIVNGTQFLSRAKKSEGHFREARVEYQKLLDYLEDHEIGGVVFLTGDRHHTEMMSLRREGCPTILEFTSSPLAWGQKIGPLPRAVVSGTSQPKKQPKKQPRMHWQLRGDSYGLITIDIPVDGDARITCEVRDQNNTVPIVTGIPCRTTWSLKELNPK
jgi:phosphodiesterase/alkaline phosphatase D-like protein